MRRLTIRFIFICRGAVPKTTCLLINPGNSADLEVGGAGEVLTEINVRDCIQGTSEH
jgi:hypothetical protein